METQIALWMWITAAGIFLVGVLVGIVIARYSSRAEQRIKELESELKQSRDELVQYRDQVTQHFLKTSDVLQTMTANYRALYEHMADGAQTLCDEQVRALSPAALRERLLPENYHEVAQAERDTPLDPSDSKADQAQPLPQEGDPGTGIAADSQEVKPRDTKRKWFGS